MVFWLCKRIRRFDYQTKKALIWVWLKTSKINIFNNDTLFPETFTFFRWTEVKYNLDGVILKNYMPTIDKLSFLLGFLWNMIYIQPLSESRCPGSWLISNRFDREKTFRDNYFLISFVQIGKWVLKVFRVNVRSQNISGWTGPHEVNWSKPLLRSGLNKSICLVEPWTNLKMEMP